MKLTLTKDIQLPTAVLGMAMRSDGSRLYAACMDGRIYRIDPADDSLKVFAEGHNSYASGCVVLPDGQTIISAGYDGQLLWHDTVSKTCVRRVQAHDFWSWQMALSTDGTRVASVSGQYLVGGEKYEPAPAKEPTVKIYNTLTGDLTHSFEHLPPVLSTAFSPDGQHLAAANMMGEVRVWELATSKCVANFTTPDFTSWGIIKSPHYCGGIYGLTFAPDGNSLLLCGMGPMGDPMAGNGKQQWQRWSWRDKPEKLSAIRDGEHGTGLQETLTHTPDGCAFVMAGRQAQGTWTTAVFNAGDGKKITSLDTKSRVTRAHFSPDCSTLYLSAAPGQPAREKGQWKPFGKVHVVSVDLA
jgi:hypothetical protein